MDETLLFPSWEPRNWVDLYEACGGKNQSPINIVTNKVEINWDLKPFEYKNYYNVQNGYWNISNTGHSVQVDLDGSAKITSGGLETPYKAVQFHFHWGRGTTNSHKMEPGSEHTIDGERYAMELHIVHIKEEHKDVADAAAKNGLAVLGFFIETGDENKNYNPLISKLADIPYHGNESQMAALSLFSLIPKEEELTKYYRYNGSLTTPGCNEGVIWTLFEKPIILSSAQVQDFWMKLYFGKSNTSPMEDNFRPAQPLDGRTVYKSDSNALLLSAKTLLLLPMATYLLLSFTQ
uniref:carbonic anhydrase 4 n=1 Tax=Euleptes europaea TaxID=460621 RepID=UPI0025419AE0|nr:carbonic anhydrase 4 [Euleptes europaea]